MKRSWRHICAFGFVIAVASLVSGACPNRQDPPPPPGSGGGEDDDRPPVVVSGGSVFLRSFAKDRGKGTNQDQGDWRQAGNGQWYHHGGGPEPDKLFVTVLYGLEDSDCKKPNKNYKVRELVISYGKEMDAEALWKKFKLSIDAPGTDPGRLILSPEPLASTLTAAKDDAVPFWLKLSTAPDERPRAVTLGAKTCKLDWNNGQIHIYQSTKKVDPE